MAATFTACNSCVTEQARHNTAARHLGEKHARMVIDQSGDSVTLQYLLLEVRSHEQSLRTEQSDAAADAYVESFEEYIKENCDSLAKIIL